MTDEALARALEQQDAAIAAMLNGDPRPQIDSLAISDDTTVFGGWGRTEKGHERVTGALRWAPADAACGASSAIASRIISGTSEKTEVTPQSNNCRALAGSLTVYVNSG